LSAEVVETNSDLKGSGNAGRIELRRMDEQTNLLAQVAKTGTLSTTPTPPWPRARPWATSSSNTA
jgi:hypothetical protein